MCGISGTIFNKDYYPGMEVRNEELYEIFNSISDIDDTVEKFLDKCWEYKSNINFLRYCNDEQERIKINILSDKIKMTLNYRKNKLTFF